MFSGRFLEILCCVFTTSVQCARPAFAIRRASKPVNNGTGEKQSSLLPLKTENVVSIGRYAYSNWVGTLDERNEEIVKNALSMVKISHLADRRLSEMSDGERQRVWIARALAQDTPLILLDEPTSFLDYRNRIEIFAILKQLSQSGKSILISTHDIDLALRYADQMWVMSDGIVQGDAEAIGASGMRSVRPKVRSRLR